MTDNNENALFILIDILKRYKNMFVAAVMVTSLTGLIYALLATSLYRADVTIISNQAEGEALSSLARQYSSLAQIAGINVSGNSPVTDTDRSLAILTSRSFIEEFAIKRNIKQILFEQLWDEDKKEWERDQPPTAAQTYEVMAGDVIAVDIDKRTNLISFSVVWSDPKIAAQWANQMIEDLNAKVRSEQIESYRQEIAFVKSQLDESEQDYLLSMDEFSQSSKLALQSVMLNLIEELTKKVMVANVRNEFAFKIIDPAVVPEKKYKPSKTNIVILSFLTGIFLGLFLILSINYASQLKLQYQLFDKQS